MRTTEHDPRTHPADPGEPQHGRPRVGVAADEERILEALAAGRRVLEIGTGLGYSTRALAATATSLVTVDPDPWVHATVVPGLPDRVVCTTDWPPAAPADLVFLDADHRTPAVEGDVQRALNRLTPGGILLLHDYRADPEVREGVRRATDLPVTEIHTTYGLGVLVKPREAAPGG